MVSISKNTVRALTACAAIALAAVSDAGVSRAAESTMATSFAGIGAAMQQEAAMRRSLSQDMPWSGEEAADPRIAQAVRGFYAETGYRFAWQGSPARDAAAASLIRTLERSSEQGLPTAAYGVPMLRAALEATDIAPETRDLLFTQAFFRYARDVRDGRLPDDQLPAIWAIPHDHGALVGPLADALTEGKLNALLDALPPADAAYHDLVGLLARYRAFAERGGWPKVGEGPTLHVGDADPRVPALRERLMMVGDLPPVAPVADPLYDDVLSAAVSAFQARHGLAADGLVGRKTLAALDRTVQQRIDQIVVNLDRMRHLPRQWEARRIEVNIADATLTFFEDDQPALRSAVIVGAPHHQTPVLATRMTAVVANPTWTVPYSIASKEILPKVRRDPSYLMDRDMRIVGRQDDPFGFGVDWTGISSRTFPFTLQQGSGEANALGSVKFAGANRFSIFLHDTPNRSLFARTDRALSHGCVRVQEVNALARAVFGSGDAGAAFEVALASGEKKWLPLAQPVPIYLKYQTVFVANGKPNFRADVYGRDALYEQRLLDEPSADLLGLADRLTDEKRQPG